MTIKIGLAKDRRIFGSESWVSNGHWLLKRFEFINGTYKMNSQYLQGVIESGVVFDRPLYNSDISFGKKASAVPSALIIESVFEDLGDLSHVEITGIISRNLEVVRLPDKQQATFINAKYGKIISAGDWYYSNHNRQLVFVKKVGDKYNAAVMGVRYDIRDYEMFFKLKEFV
jgi:hypothetical protein